MGTYDPINGGLNSLIASGRLGILENDLLDEVATVEVSIGNILDLLQDR